MKTAAVFAANLLWWLLPMASGQNKLGDFPPQVLEKLSQEMDVIQEWWCVTKGNMVSCVPPPASLVTTVNNLSLPPPPPRACTTIQDGEVCQAYYGKKGALNVTRAAL
mmetsp:Transcript_32505/g.85602  ORF Transcript_32505/g.85602 Transcript_32505/m.85602 type:complete len:108 (+) Transcript_32505:83-406(+)